MGSKATHHMPGDQLVYLEGVPTTQPASPPAPEIGFSRQPPVPKPPSHFGEMPPGVKLKRGKYRPRVR